MKTGISAVLSLVSVACVATALGAEPPSYQALVGTVIVERAERPNKERVDIRLRLYDDATTTTLSTLQPVMMAAPDMSGVASKPPLRAPTTGTVTITFNGRTSTEPSADFHVIEGDMGIVMVAVPAEVLGERSSWLSVEVRDPAGWNPMKPRVEISRRIMGKQGDHVLPPGAIVTHGDLAIESAALGGFGAERAPRPFLRAQWIQNERTSIRLSMLDDLLKSHLKIGMTEREVDALLGPPSETTLWKEWSRAYPLGTSIDSTWLVLRFEEGRLVDKDVVRD
jgi:hypothetical protein